MGLKTDQRDEGWGQALKLLDAKLEQQTQFECWMEACWVEPADDRRGMQPPAHLTRSRWPTCGTVVIA
jgi:hypothetical protein